MSRNSFLVSLSQKSIFTIFLFGKIIRFVFFLTFLYFILKGSGDIAGFNSAQTLFFFLTFMVLDTTTQFFFREVYRFRTLLTSGDFDLILSKPYNALVRILLGGADPIDLVTIPPLFLAVIYIGGMIDPTISQILFYIILLINGFIIATAFHIFVLSLGIITFEIDHTINIYRDLTSLARFPLDIYSQPLRGVLTYLLPIGIMITFPSYAFMGILSPLGILLSTLFGLLLFTLSLTFWKRALKQYSSASS